MPRRLALNAEVCREIVLSELNKRGPISACEMYAELSRVFPAVNYSIFASALTKRGSGIAVIDGVLDIVPSGLAPKSRHESRNIKREKVKVFVTALRKR